jgi:hypothetical protein
MSRPLQRPHRISFRVSAEERATIKQNRGSVDLSSYVRSAALGAPQAPSKSRRQMSDFEAAKIRHAAYFGNNLNQIARCANYLARHSPNGGTAILAEIVFSLLSLEREFSNSLNTEEQTPLETEAANVG